MDNEQKPLQPDLTQPQPAESEPAAEAQPPASPPEHASRWRRAIGWYGSHKKLSIPATVLLLLVIWLAIPWSRYATAGLVVKKDFVLIVLDSTSHTPVSGATVTAGSQSAQTDGNGKTTLHLKSGRHNLKITKKYYKDQQSSVLVPILGQKSTPSFEFTATGRQVKISVKNLINQQTLGNVDIKVADITAKTDSSGEALVVLPAGSQEQNASLSLAGYNDAQVTVKVSESGIAENSFNLTPAGKVYFLSKRTGKLDVMKANLDGTEAKVVVAATGRERDYDTVLLPSADMKYAALLTRRSTSYSTAQIYILSASNDQLLGVDNAKAEFKIIGWAGSNLIYTVSRSSLPDWQPNREKLKSYNAETGKITLLNQTAAEGDEIASAYEYYPFVMISGQNVVFAKEWVLNYEEDLPEGLDSGKQHSLSLISANGQGYKRISAYGLDDYIQYTTHSPASVYIWQSTSDGKDKYYEYTVGTSGPTSIDIDGDQFYDNQGFYYPSASGQKTLWSESRDGKYAIFIGDAAGLNEKTIQSLGKFDAYGWYGDDYVLVTKDGTELYIMSADGGKPVKITDFEPTYY